MCIHERVWLCQPRRDVVAAHADMSSSTLIFLHQVLILVQLQQYGFQHKPHHPEQDPSPDSVVDVHTATALLLQYQD